MKSDGQPDVVIIGSGPGGGATAFALVSKGLRVLLLEAGPAYDPFADYNIHGNDWEVSPFPEKIGTESRQSFGPMQKLQDKWSDLLSWSAVSGRLNSGTHRRAWRYHHVVGLGGSSLHYTGEAHRLHPDSMAMQSRFGVGADWPLSYAQLEPFYQRSEAMLGVAGPSETGARWRSQPLPLAPHKPNFASLKLLRSAQRTGLGWEPNTLAVLSRAYDGRPACNYCANCNRGCPRTDKGSVDVTFLRKAAQTGKLTVRTGCQALRIVGGDSDAVTSVAIRNEAGQAETIRTKVLVVSCGAVETPRLLLNSGSAASGLANESGLVGRNFLETISFASTGLHPEQLGSHRGLPADMISWTFNAPDAIPGVIGGCRFTSGVGEAGLLGPINYAKRLIPGWGADHKRKMRKRVGTALSVHAIGESLPNPRSFVALDQGKKDQYGVPLAKIHSYLGESELKRLAFMAGKTREAVMAAGCDSLVEEYGSYDTFSSTHVFGTCRMGTDPEASVVNPHCRSHRWKNLYVVDASVFPSSGGGEAPSLTIMALALRAGRHIIERSQRGEL